MLVIVTSINQDNALIFFQLQLFQNELDFSQLGFSVVNDHLDGFLRSMSSLINGSLMFQVVGELRIAGELEFSESLVRAALGNRKVNGASSAIRFAVYVESRRKPR